MIHTQISKGILRNFLFGGYYSNFWTFCAQASRFQVVWLRVCSQINCQEMCALHTHLQPDYEKLMGTSVIVDVYL